MRARLFFFALYVRVTPILFVKAARLDEQERNNKTYQRNGDNCGRLDFEISKLRHDTRRRCHSASKVPAAEIITGYTPPSPLVSAENSYAQGPPSDNFSFISMLSPQEKHRRHSSWQYRQPGERTQASVAHLHLYIFGGRRSLTTKSPT